MFYGPEGPYHVFAGHEITRCLARGTFQEDLDRGDVEDCSHAEIDDLENWVTKYKHIKRYPIAGRLVHPPESRSMTMEELSGFTGRTQPPKGRVNPPMYIGIKGQVLDVSFGGYDMYKPGAPYNILLGKDSSRALAKVSLDEKDVASRDISDLTASQIKVLDDWADKFKNKKLYPIVGTYPFPGSS
uniref:Cytochrome b5 heme-binding domain-containing protein n=2 Tax=Rhizochromulina marina TaxID=1034831 RepID=A0A7S2SWI1_9STRA|mmetsp:Transcript_9463/g.26775  ORF Transcript_9463/g.26775 Transcript_9463/m.26775 type:complete len:186 (+) Transcript_9463:158-715(+)